MAALALLLVLAAAEPMETLTLACQGESTRTIAHLHKNPSRWACVSFKEETVGWVHSYGTVEGFHGIRAQILLLDETQVQFGGDDDDLGSIRDDIDRVTGDTNASYRSGTRSMKYSLNCKPT